VAAYDAQDRLLTRGTVTYSWDSLGGRLSKSEGGQTTQYKHDGMGALLSVTLPDTSIVTYEYDGLQRRVAKRRSGSVVSRLVYDSQSRVVGELDANGSLLSRFIYAAVATSPDAMVRGGVTYAYVKDHLGSVRLVIDASSGTVLQRLDYDAWGVVTQNTAPGVQPFGYAGGVQDIDTGFTHFGFRDYEPASSLWTARDPIRLRVGGGYLSLEPLLQSPAYVQHMAQGGMSVPTYTYALNNPLKYTDPTGLCATTYDCCVERAEASGIDPSLACGDLPNDISKKAACVWACEKKYDADSLAAACYPTKVMQKAMYAKGFVEYTSCLLDCGKKFGTGG
jgi:RHS repeat-associated protein